MTAKRNRLWLKRTTIALVLLCGAAVVGGAVHTYVVEKIPDLYHDDDELFDSERWRRYAADDGWRESMLDDLRKNYLKPGMTRDEVLKLLGPPGPGDSHPCKGSLESPDAKDTLCYTVSVGLDPCTFLIGFDANGRFVKGAKDCT